MTDRFNRQRLTRRGVLAGVLAGAGSAALANAPLTAPRPVPRGGAPVVFRGDPTARYVTEAKLGGAVAFVLADAASGDVLAARNEGLGLPPASTMKAITALYALDRLGPGHRFRTGLAATGPVVEGQVQGDLILIGDGDPTLDTDRLLDLAKALAALGVTSVTGRFLVWGGALPEADRIAYGQSDVAGYNPAVGGLNLNFNRVHFNWKRNGDGYETALLARGIAASPKTSVSRVQLVDEQSPVFVHSDGHNSDRWTVARGALGKDGARWLPVRHPALYAGDVFRELARGAGVRLPRMESTTTLPSGLQDVAGVNGPSLPAVLQGMLKYSTNLTAEVAGLSASQAGGAPVANLRASGARMAGWAIRSFGMRDPIFADHSGLGYGSSITAADMARALQAGASGPLPGLLKPVNLGLDKNTPAPAGVQVVAKTGTLNFVSALAGYLETSDGDRKVFAILTADVERRDGVPRLRRDRPDGGRGWAQRSRTLQKKLLRFWAASEA